MPFPSAITADQKTALRAGYYRATTYAAINPNTVVFKCRVNQTTFDVTFAEFEYDTVTIGAVADAKTEYTVYVSHVDNIREAFFVGRIRAAGDSNTLYIGETSAAFEDNDYVFVVKDIMLQEKLARDVDGELFIDWDIPYHTPFPLVTGLQSVYVGVLSGGVADFPFAPGGVAVSAPATVDDWLWDADGGTFQSGTSTDQNVTIRYTVAGYYKPRVTITDSDGNENFFSPSVFVIAADYSNVVTGLEQFDWTGDIDTGWNASITAFDGVENLLDNTEIAFFSVEKYLNSSTPIVGNVNFHGRFHTENVQGTSDAKYSFIEDTPFRLEGIVSQMGKLKSLPISFRDELTPDEAQEIVNLTPWRVIGFLAAEWSNLSNIHSVDFDAVDNTYRFSVIRAGDESGLDAINDIADSTKALINTAPTGEIEIWRNGVFLPTADRSAYTTVIEFTSEDRLGYVIERDHNERVGRVECFGGWYNVTGASIEALRAVAPAIAPGSGQSRVIVSNQILEANITLEEASDEIGRRAGNELAYANLKDILNVDFPDGYHWLVPSTFQWYTFALVNTNRGITYTSSTRWQCISVSVSHNNELGTRTVSATFRKETDSSNAQVVSEVAPGNIVSALPPVPPSPPYITFTPTPGIGLPDENPAPIDTPPIDANDNDPVSDPGQIDNEDEPPPTAKQGGVVAVFNDAGAWLARNVHVTDAPYWKNIFSGQVNDFKRDPHGNGAAVLFVSGSDTAFAWCPNIFASSPVFTTRQLFTDAGYGQLVFTDTPGEIYVLAASSDSSWTWTFEFTADSGSDPATTYGNTWSIEINRGAFSSGTGYVTNNSGTGDGGFVYSVQIGLDFDPAAITEIECVFDFTQGTPASPPPDSIMRDATGGSAIASQNSTTGNNQSFIMNTPQTLDHITIRFASSNGGGAPPSVPGSATIKRVIISGTGANPFGSISYAVTRFSTDRGLNFDSPVQAGSSPGAIIGFSSDFIGGQVFVGIQDFVAIAADGGAYTPDPDSETPDDYAYAIFAYGKNTTDYIFIQDNTADFSENLVKVTGGSASFITPNDGSNDARPIVSSRTLAVSPTNLNKFWLIARFGGDYKCAYTSNAGSSWSFSTVVLSSLALAIAIRRNDLNNFQVYIVDNDVLWYSPNGGASFVPKTGPNGTLRGVQVWG